MVDLLKVEIQFFKFIIERGQTYLRFIIQKTVLMSSLLSYIHVYSGLLKLQETGHVHVPVTFDKQPNKLMYMYSYNYVIS